MYEMRVSFRGVKVSSRVLNKFIIISMHKRTMQKLSYWFTIIYIEQWRSYFTGIFRGYYTCNHDYLGQLPLGNEAGDGVTEPCSRWKFIWRAVERRRRRERKRRRERERRMGIRRPRTRNGRKRRRRIGRRRGRRRSRSKRRRGGRGRSRRRRGGRSRSRRRRGGRSRRRRGGRSRSRRRDEEGRERSRRHANLNEMRTENGGLGFDGKQ